MPSEILSKRTLLMVALAGFALSLVLVFNVILKSTGLALFIDNVAALPEEQANPGLPVRLKIPKINVDAGFEYVGLDPDGAMDVPKERSNAAWFELGQRPGENGSAVIAGHYGRENRRGSVFDDLHKLRKGDKLYVEDEKGEVITFVVSKSRRYDPKADASAVFSSNDGKSHLNLITCEGTWDESANQYSKRLVVFTEKE